MRRQLLISGLLLALSTSSVSAQPTAAPQSEADTNPACSVSGSVLLCFFDKIKSLNTPDAPAVAVSFVALLISGISGLTSVLTLGYTIISKRRENKRSARLDFSEIVERFSP